MSPLTQSERRAAFEAIATDDQVKRLERYNNLPVHQRLDECERLLFEYAKAFLGEVVRVKALTKERDALRMAHVVLLDEYEDVATTLDLALSTGLAECDRLRAVLEARKARVAELEARQALGVERDSPNFVPAQLRALEDRNFSRENRRREHDEPPGPWKHWVADAGGQLVCDACGIARLGVGGVPNEHYPDCRWRP